MTEGYTDKDAWSGSPLSKVHWDIVNTKATLQLLNEGKVNLPADQLEIRIAEEKERLSVLEERQKKLKNSMM